MEFYKVLLLGGALAVAGCIAAGATTGGASSGLKVGEYTTPFNPMHVTGADAGTTTCPV